MYFAIFNLTFFFSENFTVPTGTMVDVYIQEIHMDPNYWPDPHKFDPDRFLPEKILERHPFCYIPFSGGPRNCIGNSTQLFLSLIVLKTLFQL